MQSSYHCPPPSHNTGHNYNHKKFDTCATGHCYVVSKNENNCHWGEKITEIQWIHIFPPFWKKLQIWTKKPKIWYHTTVSGSIGVELFDCSFMGGTQNYLPYKSGAVHCQLIFFEGQKTWFDAKIFWLWNFWGKDKILLLRLNTQKKAFILIEIYTKWLKFSPEIQ